MPLQAEVGDAEFFGTLFSKLEHQNTLVTTLMAHSTTNEVVADVSCSLRRSGYL